MLSLDKVKEIVFEKYKGTPHQGRYRHILGVVSMSVLLAERYNVDIFKAQIAAFMHDYCKYESNEELEQIILKEDIEECRRFPVLYHSYASAVMYLRLGGEDMDIYNAIRNHVFGRLAMSKLEEIILISDYTEENRTYANCKLCRELVLNGKFYLAIYKSTEFTIEFVKKQGLTPHPLQLEVLNYYKGLIEE